MTDLGVVGVVSLESWDAVWRRNQHFAHQLIAQQLASRVVFVEPPRPIRPGSREVEPGITAIRPRLVLPRRIHGLAATAAVLRRRLPPLDVLWINDATFGRHLLGVGCAVLHDVTDDWRASTQHPRVRRRLIAAEDRLSERAGTVVCSQTLQRLWWERYGVAAALVTNGADVAAIGKASARELPGPGPHAVYVGTLHRDRLDLACVIETAARVGTVHLVGPDVLDTQARHLLAAVPNIDLPGPVGAADVPGWLVSADVLICPHVVTPFTLSLDAIKAHEYLATTRPVVATATSGFPGTSGYPGVAVVTADAFPAAVAAAVGRGRTAVRVASWSDQAAAFGAHLLSARRAGL